ncbi:type II CRISPR RNA-guided endonuclease Cas9 [Brumimicrobium oceani]|uniref:CRISPR-associated endonuclease Cas9 n=1 Tax=Brumimicrobium oceani TaxID=2100725 RepID=A0A2U2X280_9FLAO|nr:type II CRISPR RNA-guided endonuclease Cas9 [Brumimicrobium oceani]PWH81859.1 hypothetical protein DIT68_14295 [Brumimicrobium oceani]
MKRVLGLDLGTNSIGWALVEIDHENGTVKIVGIGSRIIPMDAGEIKDFESGSKIKSTAAQRTEQRGPRRLNERYLLRRDRLHIVLNLIDTLPKHYKLEIDFKSDNGNKSGKFHKNKEPKLAYLPKQEGKKASFLFMDSYKEMLEEINDDEVENIKGKRIPYDWTLYYLRQKALSKKVNLEELSWVLLSYNQKRGYEKTEVEDKSTKDNEIIEELDLSVKEVIPKTDKEGKTFFEVHLEGNDSFIYNEFSDVQMTFKGDLKELIKTSKVNSKGVIEDKKTEFTIIDIYSLQIENVKYEKDDGKHKYTLTYQNGWKEIKQPKNFTFKYKNVLYKPFDYIIETVYNNKGQVKPQLKKDRKLREPDLSDNSSDWTLLKKKTEKEALTFNINQGYKKEDGSAKNYISPSIYNILKSDARTGERTKIIGGMFQVVDRNFYREELKQIITTQKQFHNKLEDKKVFEQCVKTLYPKNKNHQNTLLKNKNAIQQLLVEDILLYQRPLKSKKSEISNCNYEIRYWKNAEDKKGNLIEEVDIKTGEIKTKKEPIYNKVVSATHPYFQEFRIWDKLHNLKLIQLEKEVNGKKLTNQDITKEYLKSEKEYQMLFDELNNRKSLNQDQLLSFCKKSFNLDYKKKDSNYTWNFPEDDEIKGNETKVSFATRFIRCGFKDHTEFLTQEKEVDLWHYLYSVSYKEKTADANKSAKTFFNRFLENSDTTDEVREKIISDFVNFPKFASKYCSYSEKALKKILPLIRLGKQNQIDKWEKEPWYTKWNEKLYKRKKEILEKLNMVDFNEEKSDFSKVINTSIDIQQGELPFPKGLFNTFKDFEQIEDFKKLNLTQASYLIYGRHSELAQAKYWFSPDQIRKELHQELKQHSLNNPVAEKVILEMMQVVADIWDYYGKGKESFFSKIHLEVGRELKKSIKEKESDSNRMSDNRKQNKRIRQVLEEFLKNNTYNANPNNKDHFERLKIVEESAEHTKNTNKDFFKDKSYNKKEIEDILKKQYINKSDFEKYKLWIEQGYRSPYSGQMIKITELFDGNKFNIDHIFPQASITNNSLSNKVVVENSLNNLKSDRTGREFIQNQNGQSYLGTPVCSEDEYLNIVNTQFSGTKRYILLSKEIPKGFTNSQMNNTQHISRKAMELLSHIVREPGEVEFRSKNLLPVTGRVTSELKRAWKLNEVWGELVSPRFIRMNELTKSNLFGEWQTSKSGHRYFDCNLDDSIREKDDSYDIKRIDHRHHALDALIVALCTEDHVNYINNINAKAKSEDYGTQKKIEKYRQTLKRKIKFIKRDDAKDENNWYYMLPGETRKLGVENSRRDSVLEKTYIYKMHDSFDFDYKKMILTALQGTIVTFKQNLRVINNTTNWYNNTSSKNKFIKQNTENGQKKNWSIRRSLGKDSFYGKKLLSGEEKIVIRKDLDISFNSAKIRTITDIGIQKILLNHLKEYNTVELQFEEAINYFDFLLKKQEFEAIVKDEENEFQSTQDFIVHLRNNQFTYKKVKYEMLNIFINELSEDVFKNRNDRKITEHPEIAFTNELIEEMNKPSELQRLNNGKSHKPIKKVRISRGFGNQRAINGDDGESVKSKQYVVNDAGSNLYLGFYERTYINHEGNETTERKFKDIGLMDLIESLKQDKNNRINPLPNKIFDDRLNEFQRIFTLSPLDLVYVPTNKEINNLNEVDFKNLTKEQVNRIYKYVDGSISIANFVPYAISKPIWRFHGKKNKEIFKELNDKNKINIAEKELIQNEFGLGSQQNKNQNMIDGVTQIKKICWKLKVDRLGNISKA